MSAKAISEATGKRLLNNHLPSEVCCSCRFASINETTSWAEIKEKHHWLSTEVRSRLFTVIEF